MNNPFGRLSLASLAVVALASFAMAPAAEAAREGGRGGGGGAAARGGEGGAARGAGGGETRQNVTPDHSNADARTNNVRNTSVSNVNNVNVNKNVNVSASGSGGCCHNGWDHAYHPVAATAAVVGTAAVTAAVVGSIVNAPPPGCRPVNYGGMVYQQCGSTWYQPQGTQYVVVNPPQ